MNEEPDNVAKDLTKSLEAIDDAHDAKKDITVDKLAETYAPSMPISIMLPSISRQLWLVYIDSIISKCLRR